MHSPAQGAHAGRMGTLTSGVPARGTHAGPKRTSSMSVPAQGAHAGPRRGGQDPDHGEEEDWLVKGGRRPAPLHRGEPAP